MRKRSWTILGGVVLVLVLSVIAGYELAPMVANAAPQPQAARVESASPPSQPVADAAKARKGGAWLGVMITNADKAVTVQDVVAESPAAAAGVQRGDVISSVNGNAITNTKQLVTTIAATKPGDKVTLGIQRGGAKQTIEVTLGASPAPKVPQLKATVPNPLGGLEGLLSELAGIPADQRFEHFQGGTFSFTDKDGKPITISIAAGVVATVTGTTVTIKPNAGGDETTFQVGSSTRVFPGKAAALTDSVKVGDKVMVIAKQGATDALALYDQSGFAGHRLLPPKQKAVPEGNDAAPGSQFRKRFQQGLGSLEQHLDQLRQRLDQPQRPTS